MERHNDSFIEALLSLHRCQFEDVKPEVGVAVRIFVVVVVGLDVETLTLLLLMESHLMGTPKLATTRNQR